MTTDISLIGLGKMGTNHAKWLSRLSNVYFSAISDIDPTLEKKAKDYKVNFYSDHKKMIKEENPKGVIIAVPATYHAKILRDCIDLGLKYILVEKPALPIKNIDEGKEILRHASENDSMIMVGDILCYDPATQIVVENLGKLGKISSILCLWFGPYPWRIDDVGVNEDYVIHGLSFARYLLDWKKFYITKSPIQTSLYRESQIDFSSIEAKTQDGVSFIISSSWLPKKTVRTAVVVGEKSIVEVNFDDKEDGVKFLPPKIIEGTVGEKIPIVGDALENELKHFVNCIENRTHSLTSLNRSLETLETLFPTVL